MGKKKKKAIFKPLNDAIALCKAKSKNSSKNSKIATSKIQLVQEAFDVKGSTPSCSRSLGDVDTSDDEPLEHHELHSTSSKSHLPTEIIADFEQVLDGAAGHVLGSAGHSNGAVGKSDLGQPCETAWAVDTSEMTIFNCTQRAQTPPFWISRIKTVFLQWHW